MPDSSKCCSCLNVQNAWQWPGYGESDCIHLFSLLPTCVQVDGLLDSLDSLGGAQAVSHPSFLVMLPS